MTTELLLVCLSQKPAVGQEEKRSAVRQLLRVSEMALDDASVPYDLFDIRESPFPFFDGRRPHEYQHPVDDVVGRIEAAKYVILSVPAYWGGMSGVAKNFLDVLGGAAYDAADRSTVFSGRIFGAIVVGGAAGDAKAASMQLRSTLSQMGAAALDHVVELDDPRQIVDMDSVVKECYQLAFRLAAGGGEE